MSFTAISCEVLNLLLISKLETRAGSDGTRERQQQNVRSGNQLTATNSNRHTPPMPERTPQLLRTNKQHAPHTQTQPMMAPLMPKKRTDIFSRGTPNLTRQKQHKIQNRQDQIHQGSIYLAAPKYLNHGTGT